MIQRKPAQPPKPKTLGQQHDDFTAEGSPPPGKVATSIPVTTHRAEGSRAARRVSPPRKGPPVGRSRWQR